MRRKYPWPVTASALIALNSLAAAVTVFLSLGAGMSYGIAMWIIMPVIGVLTVFIAVRRGLNGYAAFAIPTVCETLVHWLLVGYPPESAGMAILNAGLCLVAAATARVMNEQNDK